MEYKDLSEKAKQTSRKAATRWTKNNATMISIKIKNDNYEDIKNYIDRAIAQGKTESRNSFFIKSVRYAIENNLFDVDEKSE